MNLTEKAVASLKGSSKRQQLYDDAGGGFGVRVESAELGGRKNWFWRKKGWWSRFLSQPGRGRYHSAQTSAGQGDRVRWQRRGMEV